MRQIKIITNTSVYQRLLKSPEAASAGRHMTDDQIRMLPNNAYILTGEKTQDYGGGPSPDGFAMSVSNKILGRLKLRDRPDVGDGWLKIK